MPTRTTTIDKIYVIGDFNHIHVRQLVVISDNGTETSRHFSRYVIYAGDDYSTQPKEVRDICETVHTPEIVEAYLNRPKTL